MEFSELSEHTFLSWQDTCTPVLESNVGAGGRILAPWIDSQKFSEPSFIIFSCLWSAMGQWSFKPEGGFQGLGFDPATAYTVGSVACIHL